MISSVSPRAVRRSEIIAGPLLSTPPFALGYPGENSQSAYYPGEPISLEEVVKMSEFMERHSVGPENTRLRKLIVDGIPIYHLSQASVEGRGTYQLADGHLLVRRDHSGDLAKVFSSWPRQRNTPEASRNSS